MSKLKVCSIKTSKSFTFPPFLFSKQDFFSKVQLKTINKKLYLVKMVSGGSCFGGKYHRSSKTYCLSRSVLIFSKPSQERKQKKEQGKRKKLREGINGKCFRNILLNYYSPFEIFSKIFSH